jgi:hypothetical protein
VVDSEGKAEVERQRQSKNGEKQRQESITFVEGVKVEI